MQITVQAAPLALNQTVFATCDFKGFAYFVLDCPVTMAYRFSKAVTVYNNTLTDAVSVNANVALSLGTGVHYIKISSAANENVQLKCEPIGTVAGENVHYLISNGTHVFSFQAPSNHFCYKCNNRADCVYGMRGKV